MEIVRCGFRYLEGRSVYESNPPSLRSLEREGRREIDSGCGGERRRREVEIGRRATKSTGERTHVGFKFNMVKQELAELMRESLRCDKDESLALNFAFKLY